MAALAQPVPLPEQADDNALMARVAARDAAAFRSLVELHGERPYRIAWRMLGDAVEAEDVAQEALLRLWDHAARWRGDGPGVAAWLTRVATNLCLDRVRRARFASSDDVPERADDAPLADAVMTAEQARTATQAAVLALPERQRAALILTYYEDVSNAEGAAMLEMNIKAFESLLFRARAALRDSLAAAGLVSMGDMQ
jgi:RNA polymerase sigma factor (sigma-70 family)